jgi:oligopeptide/dipeptide ABC transporter ATP-binding protein
MGSEPLFDVAGLEVAIQVPAAGGGSSASFDDPIARKVIDGVSFMLAPGEALALVGESGSGKSLIATGAVDLLPAGAEVVGGTVTFAGEVLGEISEKRWKRLVGMGIGVMFQDAIGSWDPIEIIGTQSGEVLDVHEELSQEEIAQRVLDALGEVKLPKRLKFMSYPHQMSQGQAQRAMLAAALLSGPRLLIADEPLSGLDVTVARAVLDLIDDLRRKRGMALLLVTHDLAVVASVADRVAVVYGGRIVEEAPATALYHTPRHPYTDGLLGSIPSLSPGRLRPIPGDAPELWRLPAGCPFAPRCRYAVDACGDDVPEPRQVGESRVACLRAEDLDLTGIGS